MTPIDTAALRAAAEDAEQAAYAVSVSLDPDTIRALCDGYDEAQRLRDEVEVYRDLSEVLGAANVRAEAAEQALTDFVADLRALCDGWTSKAAVSKAAVRAVIDRHAPGTTGGAG